MKKVNSVIERARKASAIRVSNLGKNRLSRQQKVAKSWTTVSEKDTK